MPTRNFLSDTKGIFYTVVVIAIILFTVDIVYLVVALVNAKFFDTWSATVTNNVYMNNLESMLRNVGPITIVTINIGLILLMVVAAWKRGSNEVEDLQL